MELKKQFAVLGLFRQQRYIMQGVEVISLIGKEQRVIKPIHLPAGYIQYCLDLGFNEKLSVYAHHLVYLWNFGTYNPELTIDHIDRNPSNNDINNLRTVTMAVNNQNCSSNAPITRKYKKRLSEDTKQRIVERFKAGESSNKLAIEYKCCRTNISIIVINRVGETEYYKILKERKFMK